LHPIDENKEEKVCVAHWGLLHKHGKYLEVMAQIWQISWSYEQIW
jgi:hypothetical protein